MIGALSTLQIPSLLADPVVILILQVAIAAVGVAVSFWVANYRGEMAATKYTLNETRRREHALMLVTEPLKSLQNSLCYVERILQVGTTRGEFYIFKVELHEHRSPEIEFLFEHLKNGYPQLLQAIYRYQDSYNKIVDRVLTTYRRALDLLEQTWGVEPDLLTVVTSPKIYAARAIEAFSKEVTNRLVHEDEPRIATVQSPSIINVWSTNIVAFPETDAERIVHTLNSILEDPEIFGQLQQLWEEAKPLREERDEIDFQLERIRAYAHAGIFLHGSCTAGREAHYEHSRRKSGGRRINFLRSHAKVLILGIAIFGAGIGFLIYYQTGMPSERPRGNSGIMFGYNPSHEYEIHDVRFLMEVSPEKRTIWLEFSFACDKEGDYYLMISLPYIIDSIEQKPTPSRAIAEWSRLNATSGSLVLVVFNVADPNICPDSRAELKIVEPIKLSNFGYYVVDIPFGVTYSSEVHILKKQFSVDVPMGTDKMKGMLRVSIPSSAVIMSRTHEITDRRFNEDLQILEFNIEEPRTFSIQYMLPEKVNWYRLVLFFSGILIGAGISIISEEVIAYARGEC